MRNVCGALFILSLFLSAPIQGAEKCVLSGLLLHEKIGSIKDLSRVWDVIKLTRSGRNLVDKINAIKAPRKAWEFLPLTKDIASDQFAAYCKMSGEGTAIYLNEGATLGVLAVFLFHESFHGLDETLRDGQNENQKLQSSEAAARERIIADIARREGVHEAKLKFRHFTESDHQALADVSSYVKAHTNRLTLTSERRAYDAQWEFIQELMKAGDCVQPFLEEQASLGKVVNYNPSDEQIRRHYEK